MSNQARSGREPLVMTIGHSTRPIDEFVRLLTAHGRDSLIDVRKVPGSRHNPQFNADALASALAAAGIRYTHAPHLGGLRHPDVQSSLNLGWKNRSFRAYADYMQTADFATAIDRLVERAATERVAVMCAEALPWRCHRSLIADALLVRGLRVEEIVDKQRTTPRALTPFARVEGTRITYPLKSGE